MLDSKSNELLGGAEFRLENQNRMTQLRRSCDNRGGGTTDNQGSKLTNNKRNNQKIN